MTMKKNGEYKLNIKFNNNNNNLNFLFNKLARILPVGRRVVV